MKVLPARLHALAANKFSAMQVPPRPLSDAERAVIVRLLELDGQPAPTPDVTEWRVVGRCDCGCASIDLVFDTAGAAVLADGYGSTPTGIDVGVILWQRAGVPSGLEIYMLGTETIELPTPDSLHLGDRSPAS